VADGEVVADKSKQIAKRFRFSWRTMFLAMAGTVAVAWLFATNRPMTGLGFSVLIYAIVRSIHLGKRWVAIVASVLCLCCWIGLQFFGPYTSLKNRVRWKIGVERLQEWSVSTLDSHDPITRAKEIEEIPEDIRGVLPSAYIISDSTNVPKYVWFAVDPKRPTHGFMVGRPGFVPPATKLHTEKLADGVWAYCPDSAFW